MLTPLDIQNKDFKTKLMGYDKSEVNEFLDMIMENYNDLNIENKEYKSRILVLSEQVEGYKDIESSLKDAILIAQTTGESIVKNSEQKSSNIIDEANIEKNRILKEADVQIKNKKEEYEILKKEVYIFKTRFESFLNSQLMTIEDFTKDTE